MRIARPCLRPLIAVALLVPLVAAAQAGRIILAAGDVAIVRAGQAIPASHGTPVQTGDTIRVGPNSNAQVRFTDEGIVSLRPQTVFTIDEYAFSGQSDGNEKGLFSLLKGGMRTVTGIIGRLPRRDAYAVRTPTATIGIRGTHFTLVHCDNDCVAPGGRADQGALLAAATLAQTDAGSPGVGGGVIANGTYGGVSDGLINATIRNNPKESREFGPLQYFLATGTTLINLIAPPSFLFDRLEGQTRSRGKTPSESSRTAATSGATADGRPNEIPSPPPRSEFIVTDVRNSSGNPTVLAVAPTIGIVGAWADAEGIRSNGGAFVTASMLSLSGTGNSQTLTGFSIPGSASPPPLGDSNNVGVSGSAGSVTNVGFFDPGDGSINAHAGRWVTGQITEDTGTTSIPGGAHYIYGNLAPPESVAAKTGTFSMSQIGGTTPTNNLNQVASSFSYPSMTINFLSKVATLSSFSWSFTANSWSFPAGTAQVFAISGQGAGIDGKYTGGSCLGTGCSGPITLGVSGVFFGPKGDHLGTAFGAQSGTAISQGVRLYSCASSNC
jgi:hypothetical protein